MNNFSLCYRARITLAETECSQYHSWLDKVPDMQLSSTGLCVHYLCPERWGIGDKIESKCRRFRTGLPLCDTGDLACCNCKAAADVWRAAVDVLTCKSVRLCLHLMARVCR